MRGSGTPRPSKSEAGPSRPIRPLQRKIDAMVEQALVQPDACCVHWRPSLIPARAMPLLPSPRRDELRGDFLRRQALFGLLMALWYGVESVYQPRRRPSPGVDKAIVGLGLTAWLGPSLALLAAAGRAIATGSIHFTTPPRDYVLATDPIAFWQGVGFWLILAAGLGFGAWRYWRPKLTARAAAPSGT